MHPLMQDELFISVPQKISLKIEFISLKGKSCLKERTLRKNVADLETSEAIWVVRELL